MTCLFETRTFHAIDSVGFNCCRLALKKLLDQEELGKGKRNSLLLCRLPLLGANLAPLWYVFLGITVPEAKLSDYLWAHYPHIGLAQELLNDDT
jgi:hypothetical protein